HTRILAPEFIAVAQEPGAFAVLDHLCEDVHVGRELARLRLVAAVFVKAELDPVEVGDPDIDDELGPSGLSADPPPLAGGRRHRALRPRGLGLAYRFRCGAALQHCRPHLVRHLPDLPALPWHPTAN